MGLNHGECWICVGVVLGPHGVKGELRIKSFCKIPTSIRDYNPLKIEDYPEKVNFDVVSEIKNTLKVRSENIRDRDTASLLTGKLLFAARDKLPRTEDEEFYFADLINLSVRNEKNQSFASVTNVGDYGAGTFIEIKDNITSETFFIPFDTKFIPVVNIREKYLMLKNWS